MKLRRSLVTDHRARTEPGYGAHGAHRCRAFGYDLEPLRQLLGEVDTVLRCQELALLNHRADAGPRKAGRQRTYRIFRP